MNNVTISVNIYYMPSTNKSRQLLPARIRIAVLLSATGWGELFASRSRRLKLFSCTEAQRVSLNPFSYNCCGSGNIDVWSYMLKLACPTRHIGFTRFNPSERVPNFSAEWTEAIRISALPKNVTNSTRLRLNIERVDVKRQQTQNRILHASITFTADYAEAIVANSLPKAVPMLLRLHI